MGSHDLTLLSTSQVFHSSFSHISCSRTSFFSPFGMPELNFLKVGIHPTVLTLSSSERTLVSPQIKTTLKPLMFQFAEIPPAVIICTNKQSLKGAIRNRCRRLHIAWHCLLSARKERPLRKATNGATVQTASPTLLSHGACSYRVLIFFAWKSHFYILPNEVVSLRDISSSSPKTDPQMDLNSNKKSSLVF